MTVQIILNCPNTSINFFLKICFCSYGYFDVHASMNERSNGGCWTDQNPDAYTKFNNVEASSHGSQGNNFYVSGLKGIYSC